MKITAPVERISRLVAEKSYMGTQLDPGVLSELGFFLLKGGLGKANADRYLNTFRDLLANGTLERSAFHSTEIKISRVDDFDGIGRLPELQSVWPHFFDGHVGTSFKRLLSKTEDSPAPVILHQDICYQYGDTEQYSFFMALTDCGHTNGGLRFHPGTHQLGYLGDAGELDPNVLPEGLPVCGPEMEPGDVVIMHSALWHFSDAFISGNERVYIELHVLSAESPFSRETLHGSEGTGWRVEYDPVMREEASFFKRSRSQNLREARAKIERLTSTGTESPSA